MTDYLGPLTLGAGGTYSLTDWKISAGTASIEVIVSGTSAATLSANVEALVAVLAPGTPYSHAQPGATNVVYTVVAVTSIQLDDMNTWLGFWQRIKFELTLSTGPLGAYTTLHSSVHVNSPASLSLENLLGTRPPQLDTIVVDDSALGMHSVWLSLAPKALTDSKWLVLASSLTWATMSNNGGTLANYWGNTNRYTASATYQTALLDTSGYPAGKYKMLARVAQSSGTGYIMESQNSEPVAVTQSTPHLIVVGDLDLPAFDTARGTPANIEISARTGGTGTIYVNAFVFLPMDLGYASYHPSTPTTEIARLDVGPTGTFMDSICSLGSFTGGTLTPPLTGPMCRQLNEASQPDGSTWPTSWSRTSQSVITADTNRFRINAAGVDHSASDITGSRLVVPRAWYEVSWTRQVTSRSAGSTWFGINWTDFDGNQIAWDTISSASSTDASPTSGVSYVQAPAQAARGTIAIGTSTTATLNVYWSALVIRPSPLRLIVVAEDAGGVLPASPGNVHPVHVTVGYTPRYEMTR